MRLAIAMCTADRTPAKNYLGGTLRALFAQGVDPTRLHLCVSGPGGPWLDHELGDWPVVRHIPDRRLTRVENGLELFRQTLDDDAEWILTLEDDIRFCADFLGSVERWLSDHAVATCHLYQFFGFHLPPKRPRVSAYPCSLMKLRAAQAVALRREDARDFLNWGTAHLTDWRTITPWGDTRTGDPTQGWDKFLACWHLRTWPKAPGMCCHPHFVRHIGIHGSMHGRPSVHNDRLFAGESWSYRPPVREATAC